jgi:alpha-tubulin suppressor-like RCC1 family protein
MPKDEDGCIFLPTPKLVEALSNVIITQISCGKAHSIAIPNSNSYYSWGAAASGQLGHSNIETFPFDEDGYPYHPIPKICEFTRNVKFVSSCCGDTHTLVLSDKGEIYSFGGNSFGQLGIGDGPDADVDLDGSPYVPIPRKIVFAEQIVIVKIACGDQHSLALDNKGELYSWGSNIGV